MSIDRVHGEVCLICDECDEYYETGEKDFYTAVELAKNDGWSVIFDDDTRSYIHLCNDCSEELSDD